MNTPAQADKIAHRVRILPHAFVLMPPHINAHPGENAAKFLFAPHNLSLALSVTQWRNSAAIRAECRPDFL
jgi:hypothetical protein